jgi:hypothetical protein
MEPDTPDIRDDVVIMMLPTDENEIFPPFPVLACESNPVARFILPSLPVLDCPVFKKIEPDDPRFAIPLLKRTSPLDPTELESVPRVKDPDAPFVLDPVNIEILPPLVIPDPARATILPPLDEIPPEPTTRERLPDD